jgi:hypothetical protein
MPTSNEAHDPEPLIWTTANADRVGRQHALQVRRARLFPAKQDNGGGNAWEYTL